MYQIITHTYSFAVNQGNNESFDSDGRYIFELSARETNLMKKRSVLLYSFGRNAEVLTREREGTSYKKMHSFNLSKYL